MRTGRLCASVSGTTATDVLAKIRKAESAADLIEIRFDRLLSAELPVLLDHLKAQAPVTPLIATYRSEDQGGPASISVGLRKTFWQNVGNDFWAADQEEDVFHPVDRIPNTILSYHDFAGPAADAEDVIQRLSAKEPSIIKYAYMARDVTDTIQVWESLKIARDNDQLAVVIAMGEAGKISRILGPAHGSQWTYGSIDEQTAPGQVSLDDLAHIYRVNDITSETKVYGVIGNPVIQSLSPNIHNQAFAYASLDSVFVPLFVNDLRGFMDRMVHNSTREVDLNFAGFSVTMPHKLAVMEHLDQIDETAQAIGAVNTIQCDRGRMKGYNTDAAGFISPLLSRLGAVRDARAAVFGAGGAARACLYALKREGASIAVFARDRDKRESLSAEFGADPFGLQTGEIGCFDIVVNATSVGMNRESTDSIIDLDKFPRTKLVYDIVTSAKPTALLRDAKAAGIETISGLEMLVAQAVLQFEIWTGDQAPVDVMQRAAEAAIEQRVQLLEPSQ
jgi:3-dehydroquinate dehydratase/shikimate dehydrogenase